MCGGIWKTAKRILSLKMRNGGDNEATIWFQVRKKSALTSITKSRKYSGETAKSHTHRSRTVLAFLALLLVRGIVFLPSQGAIVRFQKQNVGDPVLIWQHNFCASSLTCDGKQ